MALVRVKRRLTDDPADALLVTSKKLKIDDDLLTTVFKFAATVKKDEEISSTLKRVLARDSKFKDEVTNVKKISEKLRAENKIHSSNNRLKVVNCFRSLDYSGNGEGMGGGGSRPLTVLHAEPSRPAMDSCNLTKSLKEAEDDYVFDLYFTSSLDICDSTVESIISAIPVENELLFDNYRGVSSEEFYDCDEDSNDENNWKNDYPDEDEDRSYSSIDEDDMRMAAHGIRRIVLDSDGEMRMASSSSSDEEEDIYNNGPLPSRELVFGDTDEESDCERESIASSVENIDD